MSFVFGLSLGNAGWLLSDTQLNFKYKNGQQHTDELEPISIEINQVGMVSWGRRFRKLTAIPNGYASGSGDAVLCRLTLDAFHEFKDPVEADELGLVIASIADRIRTPLCEQLQGTATSFDRTAFIILSARSDRPVLCSISTCGNISNLGQQYVAAWPPGLEADETHSLMCNLGNLLVPTSLDEVFQIVRVLSILAANVQVRSPTVGRHVDMGIIRVNQGMAYMGTISGVASELADMSTKELSRVILEQRTVPC